MVVTMCPNTLLHKLLGPVLCRIVKMPTVLEGLSGHLKMEEKNPRSIRNCLKIEINHLQKKIFKSRSLSEPAKVSRYKKIRRCFNNNKLKGNGNEVYSLQLFLKKLLVYFRFRLKYTN